MTKSVKAHDLAEEFGGRLVGDASIEVTGVASLEEADRQQVSFLGNPRYREKVSTSEAGIVLIPENLDAVPKKGQTYIICKNPSAAFSKVIERFAPPPIHYAPGRHPSAVIADSAQIPQSVHIGPCAVIENGVHIGENSVIGAGCYVGPETVIGKHVLLYANVTVRERCRLGNHVIVHSGTVIGSDGFGYLPGEEGHTKIPQVGNVVVEDDVEVGAQVAIDRARFGTTLIRRGAKIDNLVQIAHNVVVGEHCFIVGQSGISGSTRLGRGVIVAGQAGLAGHLSIGDGSVIMGQAGVSKDLPAKSQVFGSPAVERKEYAKQMLALSKIDRLQKQIKELQQAVAELQKNAPG